MQVVGHFVGGDADQGRCHFVDGGIELIQGSVGQSGEVFLQTGILVFPESAAAADEILPAAGLAFMDAGGSAMGDGQAIELLRHALLIHGVAGFVQGGEDRISQMRVLAAGGDAHVAITEADREGMVRFIQAATGKIIAVGGADFPREFVLLFLREIAEEAGIIDRFRGLDSLHERYEGGAQIGENGADLGGRHPFFGASDERIGDVVITGEEAGVFAGEEQRLFEVRLYGGEVVFGASGGPYGKSLGGMRRRALGEFGGHADRPFVFAADVAIERGVILFRRPALKFRLQGIQQAADLWSHEMFMGQAAEGSQLTGARRATAGWHLGRLIPMQDGSGAAQVVDDMKSGFQLFQLAGHDGAPIVCFGGLG